MKKLTIFAIMLTFFTSVAYAESEKKPEKSENSQIIYKARSQKSFKGPENLFTGDVQVDMVFPSNETAYYSGAYVTFQPGARTAWHLHPAGQHMIVTSGAGLTGTRDGKIVEIRAGDAVWCPPDIDHWHGATPHSPMTHLVITGLLDGKNVIWKEHLFADIFVRDVISHQDRELATIAALANMTGTEGQLNSHLGAAMNTGLSEAQMKDFISVLRTTVGEAQAESAQKILAELQSNRK